MMDLQHSIVLFGVFFLIMPSLQGSEEKMSMDKVVAFGRSAPYGNLYDENTASFSPQKLNIFKLDSFPEKQIPPSLMSTFEVPFNWSRSTVIKNGPTDMFKNCFEPDEKLLRQFELGLIEVTERGKFLNFSQDHRHTEIARGVLVFSFGHVQDLLSLFHQDFKDLYQLPPPGSHGKWTGAVVGVTWGANIIILWEREIDEYEGESLEDIQFHLDLQMYYMKAKPQFAPGLLQKYFKEYPNAPRFKVEITGDIPWSLDDEIRTKIEEQGEESVDVFDLLGFLDRVPSLIKKLNGGKGQEIAYDIVPIAFVERIKSGNIKGSVNAHYNPPRSVEL